MELVVRVIDDEGDTEIKPLTIFLSDPNATISDLQHLVAADNNACHSNAIEKASSPYKLYVFTSVEEALRDNSADGLPQDARLYDVLNGIVDERTPTYKTFDGLAFVRKLCPVYTVSRSPNASPLQELVMLPSMNRCEGSPHPWNEAPLPPWDESINTAAELWRFPRGLFEHAINGTHDADLPSFYFQREVSKRLMREVLQDQVVANGKVGWLEGKRGYGSTLLALAFGLVHLRHDWTITLVGHGRHSVLRSDCGGTRRQRKLLRSRAMARVDVASILTEVPSTQTHFVIVHRLLGDDKKGKMLEVIADWYKPDTGTKRLVFVEDRPPTDQVRQRLEAGSPRGEISQGLVPAWTVEEYLKAAEHDDFFNSCKDRLTGCEAEPSHELSRETRVRAKHYFTGGNVQKFTQSRYLGQLILELRWRTPVDTHDLGGGKLASVLTPYTVAAIAMEVGTDQLHALHTTEDEVTNRWTSDYAMSNGSLLEAQFYAQLHNGSVTVYVGLERLPTEWLGDIDWLDIDQDYLNEALKPVVAQEYGPQWWKRPRLNIGGYDAVYVDKDAGLVRFVQLVKPYTAHGVIHWAYMAAFLQDLMEANEKKHRKKTRKRRKAVAALVIQRVEMFVVMPEDSLASFGISEMTDVERMVEIANTRTQDSRWVAQGGDLAQLVQLAGVRGCWTSW